ncbi:cytochrome P450 [Basidiobolus meristosporus CBS 931.73]|uniref:Cytochrome P450 n=1 Tax=Basidiobolus meristosporus CBS 931.73 TaxID=1314790 RepID=A0A1Y1Y300_9FUNG|nr:cytochrome P450 [Basidiobolus meristosporus CBS 931.73]|eukprot:ORX92392.1 cytochrome P450 [Basidiobolus meristosporus CBS 931.73]
MIPSSVIFSIILVVFVKYKWFSESRPGMFRSLPKIPDLTVALRMLGGMEMADIIEKYFIPKLREHGIARTYIKGVSGVMVSKLEYFKQIYRDTATFPKVPLTSVKYSLNYKFVGANIIFTNGKEWKLRREIVWPIFQLGWEPSSIGGVVLDFFKELDTKKAIPDMYHAIQLMTLDILGKVLYGYNFEAIQNPETTKAALDMMYISFPILDRFIFGKRKRELDAVERFRDWLGNLAIEKKAALSHEPGNHRFNDLLSVLVKAWSEKQLSFDEMLNEAVVLSIAGHDTTASSLSSVIYVLAKYPAIQEKVREEVNRVLKSHASTEDIPSTAEIKMLHYLEATIKESMRLYPPAPILPTRMAACDTMLGQIPIPKGSLITLNIYALQRDEQYWENPTMVDPERWLNSGGQVQDLPAWCPFTNGSRLCIGKSFAMNEMKIVLSMLGKCSSLKA